MSKLLRVAPALLVAIGATATAAFASGWDTETCNASETYNGEPCTLIWCVNQDYAKYNCGGMATSKYSCDGGCIDPVQ